MEKIKQSKGCQICGCVESELITNLNKVMSLSFTEKMALEQSLEGGKGIILINI